MSEEVQSKVVFVENACIGLNELIMCCLFTLQLNNRDRCFISSTLASLESRVDDERDRFGGSRDVFRDASRENAGSTK